MTHLVRIFFGGTKNFRLFVCALLFSFAFLFCFSIPLNTIFAQSVPPQIENGSTIDYDSLNPPNPGGNVNDYPNSTGIGSGGTTGGATGGTTGVTGGTTGGTTATPAAAAPTQQAPAIAVGATNDPILLLLHAVFVTGLGWLVGQMGYLFDYSVETFIIGFGNLYLNQNIGDNIDNLWTTVRDIFNLTFIFGLVYIGFKMILDSSDSSARKMLISLIGAALLVNFSLFVTKFVVDFSNIAAYQVYKALAGSEAGYSLTYRFMELMGINQILGVDYIQTNGGYQYVIGLAIVLLVLGYVFLAGALMVMIRFAALCIYMVFSPFMFLGWVFPALQSYSKDYWSGFLRQAFFAPAFMFMLYLSYRVASSFPSERRSLTYVFGLTEDLTQGGFTGTQAAEIDPTIPFFVMVIVFLVASIVVAKKMGAHGATMAASVGSNITGRARSMLGAAAGGATFGLAGRLGRNTVGRYAQGVAENSNLKELAAQKGLRGWTARQQLRAGRTIADSSFDARNIAGAGKAMGIGAGAKGGYKSKVEATEKRDLAFADSLGTLDEKDILVKARMSEKEVLENQLKNLKAEREGLTGDARVAKVKEINRKEEEIKKKGEQIEKEKRRRQIGGTFEDPEYNREKIEKTDEKIKDLQARYDDGWKKYNETKSMVLKQELLKGLKELEKEKSEFQSVRNAFAKANTDGYAKVVDINGGWDMVQSYVMGRTLHESRESADAIRKKYTKETKKSKEDVNTDSIVKAVTSSAKSDH